MLRGYDAVTDELVEEHECRDREALRLTDGKADSLPIDEMDAYDFGAIQTGIGLEWFLEPEVED
jgi:hypothetical protein